MGKVFNILRAMDEYERAMRAQAIAARILPQVQANRAAGMPLREAVGVALIAELGKRLAADSEPVDEPDETDETEGTGERK